MSNLINLGLRIPYAELQAKSQATHDGFVAEVVDYPAPNPKMPDFQNDIKLKWSRPLNTTAGNVKGYIVQVSNTAVQPPLPDGHVVVNNGIAAVLTNTSVLITVPYVGGNYFWITPFNSVGFGVSSEPVFFNNPGKI